MKMRAQYSSSAKYKNKGTLVSSIGAGYMLLVCFIGGESLDVNKVITKVLNIRLFDGWKKSIIDLKFELMVLSQFTLCAKLKSNKPNFHEAEKHEVAKSHFDNFVKGLKQAYIEDKVKCGIFGSSIDINVDLDGPCTIILDL